MFTNVYSINSKGIEFCPKKETYIEKYSQHEGPLNALLRLLRDDGSKTKEEIFDNLRMKNYDDARIRHALTIATYGRLIDQNRRLLS